MKFTKMQGIGNDYVYVNCFEETVENPSETAVKVSNRICTTWMAPEALCAGMESVVWENMHMITGSWIRQKLTWKQPWE